MVALTVVTRGWQRARVPPRPVPGSDITEAGARCLGTAPTGANTASGVTQRQQGCYSHLAAHTSHTALPHFPRTRRVGPGEGSGSVGTMGVPEAVARLRPAMASLHSTPLSMATKPKRAPSSSSQFPSKILWGERHFFSSCRSQAITV